MRMAHLGVNHQTSLSERRSLLQTDLQENPSLLQAQPQRHWAASSLLPPWWLRDCSQQMSGPLLESPGAREGLRAEQGLLGSGAAACAAGIGAQRSRGPGSALWVTPSRAASVRSRCTVSSHCGCRRQEQAEQTKAVSNGAEIEQTRPSSASLLYTGQEQVALDMEGGPGVANRRQEETMAWTERPARQRKPTGPSGQCRGAARRLGEVSGAPGWRRQGGRRHWSARTR